MHRSPQHSYTELHPTQHIWVLNPTSRRQTPENRPLRRPAPSPPRAGIRTPSSRVTCHRLAAPWAVEPPRRDLVVSHVSEPHRAASSTNACRAFPRSASRPTPETRKPGPSSPTLLPAAPARVTSGAAHHFHSCSTPPHSASPQCTATSALGCPAPFFPRSEGKKGKSCGEVGQTRWRRGAGLRRVLFDPAPPRPAGRPTRSQRALQTASRKRNGLLLCPSEFHAFSKNCSP